MTFCRKTKIEIASNNYTECCNTAHLYGILSFAKSFSKDEIVVTALDKEVINHIKKQFINFGISNEKIFVSKEKDSYFLNIKDKKVIDRILLDLGYSGDEPNYRILDSNFQCENCKSAFVAGSYLTGGTITEPTKSYHLEFTTHKYLFFQDFINLLESLELNPKKAQRKSSTRIVYFKDSEQIEDILTYMGAIISSMELMNTKIEKEVVNRINRQVNCETANIDKTLLSSEKDRADIEYIFSHAGKKYLPEDLLKIAELRLEHKELSLRELGQLLDPVLTKSGVAHRINRIRLYAEELKKVIANE